MPSVHEATIQVADCPMCRKMNFLKLSETQYIEYCKYFWNGCSGLIQHALPSWDVDMRELLITGICPSCWETLGGNEDEAE